MSEPSSRAAFLRWGAAGLVGALLLTVATHFLLPALAQFALLSVANLGGRLIPLALLATLGLIATFEIPLGLMALVRLARAGAPAPLLNGAHALYNFFPAVYGALGALVTGQRWWLWLMLLLAPMRYLVSALAVRPDQPQTGGTAAPPRPSRSLDQIEGFVLDMDGVLYRGNTPREGARAFVALLQERQIPFLCLTNNASRTSAMFEEKLRSLAMPIPGRQVLGAAQATARWLQQELPRGARTLVVGSEGLRRELEAVGLHLVSERPADVVVVGITRDLGYDLLSAAALAIRDGARFVGTNPDPTFPGEEGLLPGNGAILAFLQAATDQSPEIVGKPSLPMMRLAQKALGLPAERIAMVGDRLETDIEGGRAAGFMTVLLLGGVTTAAEAAAADPPPDLILDDLGALRDAYVQAKRAIATPAR